MLQLAPEHRATLERLAAEAFPDECCGVLGGTAENGAKVVRAVVPIANQRRDAAHHRYAAPAESVREADRALGAQGLEILGFFHSHPNAPARPSAFDLEQATWPWFSYLIVSARKGRAEEITSWVLAEDRSRFVPESVLAPGVAHAPKD
jgi:proteasome lid subunit RPN8/RPN11